MIEFKSVDSNLVPYVWYQFRDFVESATDYSNGELDAASVLTRLVDKRMQLMAIVEDGTVVGAIVTEVAVPPTGGKALRVVCLGGSGWDRWGEKVVDILKKWAGDIGANKVQLTGRKGWERKLRKLNWKVTSINMEVETDG